MERPTQVQAEVLQVLRQASGHEPSREVTLLQLFEGDVKKMCRAIFSIESGLQEELCSKENLKWLGDREIDFLLWSIERCSGQSTPEFSLVSELKEVSEVERFVNETKLSDFERTAIFALIQKSPLLMNMYLKFTAQKTLS